MLNGKKMGEMNLIFRVGKSKKSKQSVECEHSGREERLMRSFTRVSVGKEDTKSPSSGSSASGESIMNRH